MNGDKQRVLIFSPFNFAPSFLGLNLEFLQKEIDSGNDVIYMTCDKSFNSCGFNTFELKYMCEICSARFRQNKKLINGNFRTVSFREILESSDFQYADEHLAGVPQIDKGFVVENFEVGESVYSSLISKIKEKTFSHPSEIKVLKKLAYQSLSIFCALKRFIDQQAITKCILFNGRWDYYRAALSAARAKRIKVQVIENLRPSGYYAEFGDALPHSMKVYNELVEKHWATENDSGIKRRIAREFFEKKRKGEAVLGPSFTIDQQTGKLPRAIDFKKKLIVLYNSSDYEFEAVGKEYNNPFFRDQSESIGHVAELVSNQPEFQLVIRMHPNLRGLTRSYLDPIYELDGKYPNVFVVKPEDVVDSYALMDHAFKVVTYVSTMGIEACYWGKPVVLLSKAIYTPADVAYIPDAVEAIPDLLFKELIPKPQGNAEKFAYFFRTGGIKAKYYSSDSQYHEHYFKERSLVSFPMPFKVYYKALKALRIRN